MDFDNRSPLSALAYVIEDSFGATFDVIVARGTFELTPLLGTEKAGAPGMTHVAKLADEQEPLAVTDEYFGEMNQSSVRSESDLAQFKPKCDVIVIGSAHSPTGEPVPKVEVRVHIERRRATPGRSDAGTILENRLTVTGPRWFVRGEAAREAHVEGPSEDGWSLTPPEPFTEQPIRYEHAFGGELRVYPHDPAADRVGSEHRLPEEVLKKHPQGEKAPIAHTTCLFNPVGAGFLERWYEEALELDRWPAPQITAPDAELGVKEWRELVDGKKKPGDTPALTPSGFGILTKAWQPRLALAGTFDAEWLEKKWPLMPADFKMAYWNGAHPKMICGPLFSGDVVTLENLVPRDGALLEEGHTVVRFAIPDVIPAACLTASWVESGWVRLTADTLILDLEKKLVSLVWRLFLPDKMKVEEAVLAVPQIEGAPDARAEE